MLRALSKKSPGGVVRPSECRGDKARQLPPTGGVTLRMLRKCLALRICVCSSIHLHIYTYMHANINACMQTQMHACMHAYMLIYIYICKEGERMCLFLRRGCCATPRWDGLLGNSLRAAVTVTQLLCVAAPRFKRSRKS